MHWLGWIRFFEAAARHESFVRAAEELHLTHGAVSRQIRQLEDTLGVALLRAAQPRGLPDRGGAHAVCGVHAIDGGAGRRAARIRTQPPGRALVLSCEPTIAMRWLIPRLPRFAARHPDIPLHLMAAGGPIDFTRSGADLALRRNDFAFDARARARGGTGTGGAGVRPQLAQGGDNGSPVGRPVIPWAPDSAQVMAASIRGWLA